MDVFKLTSLWKMNGILFLLEQILILSQSVDAGCDPCGEKINQFCCIRPQQYWGPDNGQKVCCSFPDGPQEVCMFSDGHVQGGPERRIGYADTEQDCARKVKSMNNKPMPTGATWNTNITSCWAEYGYFIGPTSLNYTELYRSCLFSGPSNVWGPPHLKGMMCIGKGVLDAQILPPECVEAIKDVLKGLNGSQSHRTFLADAGYEKCTNTIKSNPKIVETVKQKIKEIAPGCGVTVSHGSSCSADGECPGDTGCCVDGNCAEGYRREFCKILRYFLFLLGLATSEGGNKWRVVGSGCTDALIPSSCGELKGIVGCQNIGHHCKKTCDLCDG